MKRKRLPRLWCALQGLLPLEACLAAQRAELAWPRLPGDRGREARLRRSRETRARETTAQPRRPQ